MNSYARYNSPVLQRPLELAQYLAIRYTERLDEAGAVASVRSRGDSYDNAMAEAFNSLFKAELVRNRGPWKNIDDLEIAVAEYIDWFNFRRLHGEIGLVPPVEYETIHHSTTLPEQPAQREFTASPSNPVLDKNGDRWTITDINRRGDLTVRHNRSQLTTRLPAEYVHVSTGLGYAITIHGAQGVSADTMHGLLTGQESRQQLYTMLTRGRHANHRYLQSVGDGDPHSLIRPETIAPRTPLETLQQIVARNDAPTSATTQLQAIKDPAGRLFDAVQRYTDSLNVALEQLVPPEVVQQLDSSTDLILPGLTNEPSWPTLRAHLLKMTVQTGEQPLERLYTAAIVGSLHGYTDKAAVLEWRLLDRTPPELGPLPWIPGPPQAVRDHPTWGAYLAARSRLVEDLAGQVQSRALHQNTPLIWAQDGSRLPAALIGFVAVWRAAVGVDPHDRRPTGPAQLQLKTSEWQQRLDRGIADNESRARASASGEVQGPRAPRRPVEPYQSPGRSLDRTAPPRLRR